MGENADRIEERIRQQRGELQQNISELQSKAARTVDWRAQFEDRPMMMIGLAFGGGVLLSTLTGRRRAAASPPPSWQGALPSSAVRAAPSRSSTHSWERMKGALLGVAATRLGTVVETWLPGFREGYDADGRA